MRWTENTNEKEKFKEHIVAQERQARVQKLQHQSLTLWKWQQFDKQDIFMMPEKQKWEFDSKGEYSRGIWSSNFEPWK